MKRNMIADASNAQSTYTPHDRVERARENASKLLDMVYDGSYTSLTEESRIDDAARWIEDDMRELQRIIAVRKGRRASL